MKWIGFVFLILLVCIIARAESQVEQDSIFASLEPLDINLPKSHGILSARYSPSGNKLLILAEDIGPGDYWEKDYFLIIRKRKGPHRSLPKFLKVVLPAMVEFKIAGEIRVTILKKETRPDFGICWINEREILMGMDRGYGEGKGIEYFTAKYDIFSGSFSTVFEENDEYFRIMDVLGDSYLTRGLVDEQHWFLGHFSYPGIEGVLPLLMRNISGECTQEVLTPLHPDSTYIGSMIMNAGFVSKEEVVFQKIIVKEEDEVGIAFQSVNLRNGEIRTLSTETGDVSQIGGLHEVAYDVSGFTVSPDGKWIAYSSRKKGIVFLSTKDGRTVEISIPKGFKDKNSEWNYRESYHLVVLDWSTDGRKILCNKETTISKWTGSKYKRREEKKLCLLDVPEQVKAAK